MAGAGPVWMCGYDDHSLPPVRGEGNQAMNVGAMFAVNSALVAILARGRRGGGQRADVSIHAALNVTTEMATVEWLTMGATVQRQAGRHASVQPTLPTQVQAADGKWVTTGFAPRFLADLQALLGWLEELELADGSEGTLIRMAIEAGGIDMTVLRSDPLVAEMYGASREAMVLIASALAAMDFFIGAQERGLAVGIINSPESVIGDEHMRARHAFSEIHNDVLGTSYLAAGRPFVSTVSPYRVRGRAPLVGEHNADIAER
jgi:crotonobetainyl-CoA:carnitine CoA-transferase CaiB-like acyl-CoA transferase